MSYAVFLNGEMLDKETAVRVLGGQWEQKDFSLEGYETKTAPCGKACVEKNGEGRADGAVAWLEENQLWRLDQWKDIPALQRVSTRLWACSRPPGPSQHSTWRSRSRSLS